MKFLITFTALILTTNLFAKKCQVDIEYTVTKDDKTTTTKFQLNNEHFPKSVYSYDKGEYPELAYWVNPPTTYIIDWRTFVVQDSKFDDLGGYLFTIVDPKPHWPKPFSSSEILLNEDGVYGDLTPDAHNGGKLVIVDKPGIQYFLVDCTK